MLVNPMRTRVRSEISTAVAKLERLKRRRRTLVRKLEAVNGEIREAQRVATSLLDDTPTDVEAVVP